MPVPYNFIPAPVAQLDRALVFGTEKANFHN
jgi:hypothetical protein